VGILTASTTTEGLKVSDTQTVNTGTVNAISGTMTPSPTGATDATYRSGSFITSVGASSDYAFTGSVIGLFGQTQILSTHTTGTISNTYGLSFSASNRSPATATNVYGCSTVVSNRGSGTTTNAYGFYTNGYTDTNDALNGTMTTFYGLRIGAFSKGANTTLTNQYGISIADVNQGASLNYAIYTNAGLVHFGDDVDLASGQNITLVAGNIVTDTTTGTQLATSSTQKLGFYGATAVVRQAHIADPSGGGTVDAEARTAINAILSTLETYGLLATS
jgi:hypothetical protein